jgi:long-subunit acyl-CoA synthetase (AMP-forming)
LPRFATGEVTGVTGSELLEHIRKARTFIASKRLKKGDRCGLLAANSIRWVAMDLALMAEGLIVVPLYSRQAPAELVAMMKDSTPSLVCCGDAALLAIAPNWPEAPPQHLFDEIFAGAEGVQLERPQVGKEDPVTIIYTLGDFRRSQGRGAHSGECWLYVGSDGGAAGAVDVRVDGGRSVSFIICPSHSRRRGLRC